MCTLDLHLDTLIPHRLYAYDPLVPHAPNWLIRHRFGHADLPRLLAQSVRAAMWSVTTNPVATPAARFDGLLRGLALLDTLAARAQGQFQIARTVAELDHAANSTAPIHVALPAIQGGNCLDACPDLDAFLASQQIWRVTLVHLTDSIYGETAWPATFAANPGLTPDGETLIHALDRHRVAVDLAHIGPRAFWDAVAVHDPARPLFVTHAGARAVRDHPRNLDDRQIAAVAATGGVIGLIFAAPFLFRAGGPRDAHAVAEHLEHLIAVGGEGCAAIGSDYDGAIVPPDGMRDGYGYVRLIEVLRARAWPESRIAAVCWDNARRALGQLRPATSSSR
jgi:membrane dipeptidase